MPYSQGYFDAVYGRPHDDGYAFSDQEKSDYHNGYTDGLLESQVVSDSYYDIPLPEWAEK